ncbi:membrane protein [Streptomyces flaveus]|uniref:Membrane protein n=2 Tax=Streptomyces TaxID=1883 RepID=A0A917QXT1_9ACTN|nr:membrane protein [Streptomyces flaveus]
MVGTVLMTAFGGFMSLLFLGMLVLAVVALVMAAMARDDAYRAADKQNKMFWMIMLGVTVAVNLLVPILFLQIAGLIATIVFFVDVRPAIKQVSGGGGRRGGSSSDGPYGPYNGGR